MRSLASALLVNTQLRELACGQRFSAALAWSGAVYVWGLLGGVTRPTPTVVKRLEATVVARIACGQEHLAMITGDRESLAEAHAAYEEGRIAGIAEEEAGVHTPQRRSATAPQRRNTATRTHLYHFNHQPPQNFMPQQWGGQQGLPGLIGSGAQGGHRTNPGDDNFWCHGENLVDSVGHGPSVDGPCASSDVQASWALLM